jgi:hypothetical protein
MILAQSKNLACKEWRKTQKTFSHSTPCPGQDSKQAPPEYMYSVIARPVLSWYLDPSHDGETEHRNMSRTFLNYFYGMWSFARQRLRKDCLKVGITAEAEVILARQRPSKHSFPLQRMLTKAFRWQHKRTEEVFDVVTSLPAAWLLEKGMHSWIRK